MKKKILNTIGVMGVLALAGFCLSACDHELDIQQAYPFTADGGDTLYAQTTGTI